MSASIAEKIVDDIAAAGWPVGNVVANEAELTRRFGASRAVVREALGLIELRGIGTMKAGKGGGLLVTSPAYDATVTALAIYLELADVRIEDILEVWQLLMAKAVEQAIQNMGDADAGKLERFSERFATPVAGVEPETATFREFWNLLAEISGNPLLELLIAGFQIALSGLSMSRLYEPAELQRHLAQSKENKRVLINEILSCDLFMALSVLRRDFQNQHGSVRRSQILTMSRINEDGSRKGMKLPRWIAFRISRQIADQGLEPGAPLGSEADLLAQFHVSRSVLREAIRMLEAYSVVEMRRGQGGGLRVSTPDPNATFKTIVRFIRTMPLSWDQILDIRDALEVRYAGKAAKQGTPDQLAGIGEGIASANSLDVDDGADRSTDWMKVPLLVAQASGNSVAAFITGVMLQIIADARATEFASVWDQSLESYRGLYGAVLARDSRSARRIMHQHLRILRKAGAKGNGRLACA